MSSSALLDASFNPNETLIVLIQEHRQNATRAGETGVSGEDGQQSQESRQEFIDRLFGLMLMLNVKPNAFRKLYQELLDAHQMYNLFLLMVKLGQ